MKRIRAVLFDAAGTLIDLRESVGTVYSRFAREFGVAIPAGRLDDAFGRILRNAQPMAFPDATPGERRNLERHWWWTQVRGTLRAADSVLAASDFQGGFEAFFAVLFEHFGEASAWRLRPGAVEAVSALREHGYGIALVSNFDHRLKGILRGLAVAELFDTIVQPLDVGYAKPDPRIFRAALERLAVPASAAVYVGDDSQVDIAGARAVGMRAIEVTSLATLAHLPARLDRLQGERTGAAPGGDPGT